MQTSPRKPGAAQLEPLPATSSSSCTQPATHVRLDDRVSADGMRYTQKSTGSRFSTPLGSNTGHALSCFFCGTHRVAGARVTQRVLGKNHQVCNPPCPRNPLSKSAAKPTR